MQNATGTRYIVAVEEDAPEGPGFATLPEAVEAASRTPIRRFLGIIRIYRTDADGTAHRFRRYSGPPSFNDAARAWGKLPNDELAAAVDRLAAGPVADATPFAYRLAEAELTARRARCAA